MRQGVGSGLLRYDSAGLRTMRRVSDDPRWSKGCWTNESDRCFPAGNGMALEADGGTTVELAVLRTKVKVEEAVSSPPPETT